MAMNAAQAPTGRCRLCEKRPAGTKVYYDEVLASRTASAWRRYSNHSLSMHGNMTLCAECASQYENADAMRKNGRRLINWGLIVMAIGVLVFGLTLASVQGSLLELATTAPVLIGIILLGIGLGLSVTGNRLKQPMTRYLMAKVTIAKQ